MPPLDWIDEQLDHLEQVGLLRQLPTPLGAQGAVVEVDGRMLINFASNDYLGLAADERLVEAAIDVCRRQGVGRGASPLVCGRAEAHDALERRLAELLGTEAALLFPTSFAANAGVIPALVDRGDAIYTDARNHASIIDGCRLARAERHVYAHADADSLEALLQDGKNYRRRLIVTDALFSMQGNLAPLVRIGQLAEQYDAMLMVDETHAIGVFGPHGGGVVEQLASHDPALPGRVHVRVGTFGKALGAAGGFVCGSSSLVRWLANRARTFVFSTAHPAAISVAAAAALDVLESEPHRRRALLDRADALRGRLQVLGWNTASSASQIIPLVVGDPQTAVRISHELRQRGIWLPAIRPPSVPPGESLLRLGLVWGHTEAMVDRLCAALGSPGTTLTSG